MSKIILKVDEVSKIYKNKDVVRKGEKSFQALKKVSFEVHEGEIFSIIGLNGAGKTSLIKSILGLIKPSEGKIDFFGKGRLEKKTYGMIGYLPEISYYPKEVTLKNLLHYYADLYQISNKSQKVLEVVNRVGLSHKLHVKLEKFSKGMLQRVGIAQAIINNPKVLILDEPMSGLDPLGRKLMKDLIVELNHQGTTVILTTHILSDIESFGGRIGILNGGILKKTFSYEQEENSYYEIHIQSESKNIEKSMQVVKVEESILSEELSRLAREGARVLSIEHSRNTLETIFLETISHLTVDKSTLE